MTIPRSSLVSTSTTPYYHCIGRCVRRAFLCGLDQLTGRSFEHRRGWIVEKLAQLSSVFAIHVCAYAVMSNHYHLVLKLDPAGAEQWSVDEVLERWCQLFSGPLLIKRFRKGESLSDGELAKVKELSEKYRSRLCSLSWFMRCLNESIARMANAEDGCTGRFWEGRFKSQALLDEQALISCMAYVDLNPIRAGIAQTPEQSDYTSIQQRVQEMQSVDDESSKDTECLSEVIPELLRFSGKLDDTAGLPSSLKDYLELVDWSGRAIHPDKKGKIPDNLPPILQRLGIEPASLLQYLANKREARFCHVVGKARSMQIAAIGYSRKFLKGISTANRMFPQLN